MLYKKFLGGTLALVVLAVNDDGQTSGNIKGLLYDVWKGMAEDGVITMVRGLTKKSKI